MSCLPTYKGIRYKSTNDLFKSIKLSDLSDEQKIILGINKYDWSKNTQQVVDSGIDAKTLKRGDIIEFQQQNFQIERVTEEGFDVRDVNTGEVDFITKEDYESENKKELKPNVANNKDTQEDINNEENPFECK